MSLIIITFIAQLHAQKRTKTRRYIGGMGGGWRLAAGSPKPIAMQSMLGHAAQTYANTMHVRGNYTGGQRQHGYAVYYVIYCINNHECVRAENGKPLQRKQAVEA